MSSARPATPGKSRLCPHCKATILDSASVCPGCRHHLRFDSVDAARRAVPSSSPLRVEGVIRHPDDGPAWEYSDRKSTRLNSSHVKISYAVFCLKKKHKDNTV